MKIRAFLLFICSLWIGLKSFALQPIDFHFDYDQCQGSLMPYPSEIPSIAIPDSLVPVMINHVGRHGARYPASATHTVQLQQSLLKADSLATITDLGRELLALTNRVVELSQGRWGALDSLGMAEQRGIASRMYRNFPQVFKKGQVAAISSYSPRCMMSMYEFTHQLDCLDKSTNFITTTGKVNDLMLRPFDIDSAYIDFRKGDAVNQAYAQYFTAICPTTAIRRVVGEDFPFKNNAQAQDLAILEYYVIAGLSAMSVECDASKYFTMEEYNALWSCFNLRQYLQRTSSSISSIPSEIASPLLSDLIASTEEYIESNGQSSAPVLLRFGHAETLMPLLSLMRMPGCYYITGDIASVAQHWQDFYVVPMAANLQMILFESKTGNYYVRFDLNECPIPLLPNSTQIYIPWSLAKQHLQNCLY